MKKNQIPTKDAIIGHLKQGIVEFKFTKSDGEVRKMKATLSDALIEQKDHKETSPNPYSNPDDLVVCWDTVAGGWRSFKPSTLIEYMGKK